MIYPVVSIMMPVRNESLYIKQSLNSVLSQDYPKGLMEVILVDGMSDDGTRKIAKDIMEGNLKKIGAQVSMALIDNPRRTAPVALNIGLAHAAGDIIIRIDGHCEIPPDYVRRCVEMLRMIKADCAGGVIVTIGQTWPARAIALAQSSIFGVGGASFRTGRKSAGYVDTLAFGAYRREVFSRIGNFDEELARNQDDEFNFRLIQAGGKIWLDPSLKSIYYSRANLKGLWRQYFQYGFWKVRVIQKRGAIPSFRHIVPLLFVLGILFFPLAAVIPYLIVNLCASLWEARKDRKAFFILPPAFFAIHFSYGAGFLCGLWRWIFVRERILDRVLRRVFDIVFSSLVLFFGIPIFIIAAVLIKLDTPGPVFFRQKRVGRNGRIFTILKFRTMRNASGPLITSRYDARITGSGRILKRTNFDEIPQFINILKGDMAVVGPRPEIPEVVKTYTEVQKRILSFKPGFTSFATAKFLNEEELLSGKELMEFYINEVLPVKIEYDMEYFTNKTNLLNDLALISKTILGTFCL